MNVSDQTIRNIIHEGGLRTKHPLVFPVLNAWHRGARLAFAIEYHNWQVHRRPPVLFTDESRFILSICSKCERAWRSCGESIMSSIFLSLDFWHVFKFCKLNEPFPQIM